jgi:hypothetical protein
VTTPRPRPGGIFPTVVRGTGLFESVNGGLTWKRLADHGLPKPPVRKISAQVARSNSNRVYVLMETGDGLRARVLDPRRRHAAQNGDAGGAERKRNLFAPRPTYRFRNITADDDARRRDRGSQSAVRPPVTFSLKAAPRNDVRARMKIVITDVAGKVVRTLDVGKAAAGMNRVWWDLRMDPTDEIRLRTCPLHTPEFALGPDRPRKFPTAAALSVLVSPGTYTVKLVAADWSARPC